MSLRHGFDVRRWPVLRQLLERDAAGLGRTAYSERTENLRARTAESDRVVKSVCPYFAVGCGQEVHGSAKPKTGNHYVAPWVSLTSVERPSTTKRTI